MGATSWVVDKAWDLFDGKKIALGYITTQLPFLNQPTLYTALSNEIDAGIRAYLFHDYDGLIEPSCVLAGQILLAIGVLHRQMKIVAAKRIDSIPYSTVDPATLKQAAQKLEQWNKISGL